MGLELEIEDSPDREWNARLLSSPLGTIHNTKEYAEYAKRNLKWEPLFVKFVSKGNVASQLLLFKESKYHRILKSYSSILPNALLEIGKRIAAQYRWMYGPVIFDADLRNEVYEKLAELLSHLGKTFVGSIHPLDNEPNPFDRLGFKKELLGTFVIDLTKEKEKLWLMLDKKSARKNVERARERKVYVKIIEEDDFHVYFKLLNEHRTSLKVPTFKFDYIYDLWSLLKNIGFTGFITYQGNVPLGGILISTFNKYLNEWAIARSIYDEQKYLYAQDLLKWYIIEWGHDEGFRYYDLTGVNPIPTDKKEIGIFRYKQKWGGTFYSYPIYKKQ